MSDQMQKAREALKSVMREFEPTKGHFVTGTREFLLALRSIIDAQINLLDRATGKLLLLHEDQLGGNGGSWHRYYAYNLKDLFGLSGGKRTFDIKFYYLGIGPGKTSDPADFVYARPGDYTVLEFLRLEAD